MEPWRPELRPVNNEAAQARLRRFARTQAGFQSRLGAANTVNPVLLMNPEDIVLADTGIDRQLINSFSVLDFDFDAVRTTQGTDTQIITVTPGFWLIKWAISLETVSADASATGAIQIVGNPTTITKSPIALSIRNASGEEADKISINTGEVLCYLGQDDTQIQAIAVAGAGGALVRVNGMARQVADVNGVLLSPIPATESTVDSEKGTVVTVGAVDNGEENEFDGVDTVETTAYANDNGKPAAEDAGDGNVEKNDDSGNN